MEWWSQTTTNCYETWTDLVQGELRQVTASLWTSVSSAIKWGLDEVSKLWQGKTVTIFLADLHFLLTQKKWSTFILKLSLTFEIPSLLFLTLIKKFFLLKFWSLPFFPLTSSLFLPPIHCQELTNCQDPGSISDQGTKSPHAVRQGQKEKKKKRNQWLLWFLSPQFN